MFKTDRIGISIIFFPQRGPLFYPKKELSLLKEARGDHFKVYHGGQNRGQYDFSEE